MCSDHRGWFCAAHTLFKIVWKADNRTQYQTCRKTSLHGIEGLHRSAPLAALALECRRKSIES